jgi:RNA polymerase sigma-70 factor, ECF subfamily
LSLDGSERVLPFPLLRERLSPRAQDSGGKAEAPSPSDEELLERAHTRDEEATLALFRRYERLAYSIGLRILGDAGEAEDLTQEIFLRLAGQAKSFDPARGAARTWIVQMIYRRAFDRRAWLGRRQFYAGTGLEDRTNALVGAPSPEEAMIDRLTVDQLRAAFADLTERQRETLEAFFFEGLSLREIAERSGEELSNVRHHYYRGLERLRQLVRKQSGDQGEKS